MMTKVPKFSKGIQVRVMRGSRTFYRGGGGGGGPGPTARKQSGQRFFLIIFLYLLFFRPQLTIQFTEGDQWFYNRKLYV